MEATTAPITVEDKAARKIAALARKDGRDQAILRIRVTAGGCSGFGYKMSFEDSIAADDFVIDGTDEVRVLVDPRSAPIVEGSTLWFDDSLMGGGLKIRNPQAVNECSCGESFGI
jgi:iron-sulfur cluster assembly accessory protein